MGHCKSEHCSMVQQHAKLRRIIHSLTLSPPLSQGTQREKKNNPGILKQFQT